MDSVLPSLSLPSLSLLQLYKFTINYVYILGSVNNTRKMSVSRMRLHDISVSNPAKEIVLESFDPMGQLTFSI